MANADLERKDFKKSEERFSALGNYKDSKELMREARYQYVLELRDEGKFLTAIDELRELGAYKNSRDLIQESKYEFAKTLVKQGHYSSRGKTSQKNGTSVDMAWKMVQSEISGVHWKSRHAEQDLRAAWHLPSRGFG